MKPKDFLPHPNPPPLDDSTAANGNQQPPAEAQPRKSWMTEAFDWALALGGFWLLNNYLFGRKRDN